MGATETGYEAAYIRSYESDRIAPDVDTPDFILAADEKRTAIPQALSAQKSAVDEQQQSSDAACGVAKDATVPLLKWPKALKCRWENLRKITPKDVVKISYKNAQ